MTPDEIRAAIQQKLSTAMETFGRMQPGVYGHAEPVFIDDAGPGSPVPERPQVDGSGLLSELQVMSDAHAKDLRSRGSETWGESVEFASPSEVSPSEPVWNQGSTVEPAAFDMQANSPSPANLESGLESSAAPVLPQNFQADVQLDDTLSPEVRDFQFSSQEVVASLPSPESLPFPGSESLMVPATPFMARREQPEAASVPEMQARPSDAVPSRIPQPQASSQPEAPSAPEMQARPSDTATSRIRQPQASSQPNPPPTPSWSQPPEQPESPEVGFELSTPAPDAVHFSDSVSSETRDFQFQPLDIAANLPTPGSLPFPDSKQPVPSSLPPFASRPSQSPKRPVSPHIKRNKEYVQRLQERRTKATASAQAATTTAVPKSEPTGDDFEMHAEHRAGPVQADAAPITPSPAPGVKQPWQTGRWRNAQAEHPAMPRPQPGQGSSPEPPVNSPKQGYDQQMNSTIYWAEEQEKASAMIGDAFDSVANSLARLHSRLEEVERILDRSIGSYRP